MKNSELEEKLKKIWNDFSSDGVNGIDNLELKLVLKRGFCYADPEQTGKTMVIGFNPSFKEGNEGKIHYTFINAVHPYFSIIRNTLNGNTMNQKVDDAVYLDLFYFRYTIQAEIQKMLDNAGEKAIAFMIEQLKLTQEIIEDIKPKLMIVFNTGAWAYLGFSEKFVWMGYTYEEVKDIELKRLKIKEGKLMRITGLKDPSLRINPSIQSTNLVGTLVYFSRHLSRVPMPKRMSIHNEIKDIKTTFSI